MSSSLNLTAQMVKVVALADDAEYETWRADSPPRRVIHQIHVTDSGAIVVVYSES